MSLSVTPSSSKRNSASLDLLTSSTNVTPTEEKLSSSSGDSPRDSLSPLDGRSKNEFEERGRSRRGIELLRDDDSPNGKQQLTPPEAGSRKAQKPHITFLETSEKHEVATFPAQTEACLPRSPLIARDHRPSDLSLTKSNGLTTIPADDLKQCICDDRTAGCESKTQVPRPKSKPKRRLPKTPIVMGNTTSTSSGTPGPDNASTSSVVRNPIRILRKSSTNLFKRIDSKSPLPPEVTSTVIQVQQQVSPTTFDGVSDENDESPIDPFMDGNPPSRSPNEEHVVHSASTVTITDESALRPLSASTTIRDSRVDSRRQSRIDGISPQPEVRSDSNRHLEDSPPPPPSRGSVLSPSIPAPSPLPEDSPHKYGLKDRMDTPDMPEPEDINVVKARRKSSGLDIFNEAKSLQFASSFLNGLSTSRRRAESAHRSTDASGWTTTSSYDITRPSSTLPSQPSSTRPSSTMPSNTYSADRRRGHTFKPSGFAYSLPLIMAQIKCYRNHVRLLPSRNKVAPVECSVCHIDDDQEHWSCSWCALRMCKFCRQDFSEHGMTALRDRIKQAELGGSSLNGSSEDLGGVPRGRRAFM